MDEHDVLVIPTWADRVDEATGDWRAGIEGIPGLDGLFGFGPTMAEARKALAGVVWTAIKAGHVPELQPTAIGKIRLLTTTRKTYDVNELD